MTTTHAPPEDLIGDVYGTDGAETAGADQGPTTRPTSTSEPDPAAPFGYTLDGKPRKSRAGRPRGRSGSSRSRSSSTSSTKAPGARKSSSRSSSRVDYETGLLGLVQLVGVPLTLVASADGATLALHGEELAKAFDQLGNEDPRVGAILDKLLTAGPYGIVLAPLLKIGAQLAVNHGALPLEIGKFMGAVHPDQLLAAFGLAPTAPTGPTSSSSPGPAAAAA